MKTGKVYPDEFKKIVALDKELQNQIRSLFSSAISTNGMLPNDEKIMLFLCQMAGLPLNKPLSDVLPERVVERLRNAEVVTIGQLARFSGNDLLKFREMGQKALSDINTMFTAAMGHLSIDFSNNKQSYCSIILDKFRTAFLADYAFYIRDLTENYQADLTDGLSGVTVVKASELRQKAYDKVTKEIAEVEAEILKASDAGEGAIEVHLPCETVRILAPYFRENGFEVYSWDESLEITWIKS